MLKTLTKLFAMGALFSLAACGGMYDDAVSAENAPTASMRFAAHSSDFSTGSYYLDVAGAFRNGTSITGTCNTDFIGGCFPITPVAGLAGSDGTGTQATETDDLCPGIWNFTDSQGQASLKLRDTIAGAGATAGQLTASQCDYTIPEIANCRVDGSIDGGNVNNGTVVQPGFIDQAEAAGIGEDLRLRPGSNNVQVTCTLQNSSVTFTVGVE